MHRCAVLTSTCGSIDPVRVESATPRQGDSLWVVCVAAAQVTLACPDLERRGVHSSLGFTIIPLSLNLGDAPGTDRIGV